MRILAISDIHGNIDALQAIDEPYERIICTGDIVDYGPEPAACIDFLRGRDVLRVRGNHDHAVAFCQDCRTPNGPLRPLSVASRKYTLQVLGRQHTKWLGQAATSVLQRLDGQKFFAAHGAPSNHMYMYLNPDTPERVLAAEAAKTDADMIFVGHSHRPFVRRVGRKLIVNLGSVGQPRDGIANACYAIIEDGDAEIRRVQYDIGKAVARTMELPLDETIRHQLVYLLQNARTPPAPPAAIPA